jgi:ABC-type glycerol-3-phosphate transport system permease component
MKNAAVLLISGIFFAIVAIYIMQTSSPFDSQAIQELIVAQQIKPGDWEALNLGLMEVAAKGFLLNYLNSNAYLGIAMLAAAVIGFFGAFHMAIDKFFFKNFYEKPSLFNALRRGVLLALSLLLVLYMKLQLIEVIVIILVPVVVLIVELIFSQYIRGRNLSR